VPSSPSGEGQLDGGVYSPSVGAELWRSESSALARQTSPESSACVGNTCSPGADTLELDDDDDDESPEERSRSTSRRRTTFGSKNTLVSLAMARGHSQLSLSTAGVIRTTAWKIVHGGHAFDGIMGIFILVSAVSVGLEIQWDLQGREDLTSILNTLEHFYLVLFVIELFIRLAADGKKAMSSVWFQFDAILVSIGVVANWIWAPIMQHVDADKGTVDSFSILLVFRTLRLLRLVRAFRMMEQFQDMWKLASGLLSSLRTVLSACLLVVFAIYAFACVGVELITKNEALLQDPETANVVERYFKSVQLTMLTLFRFTNADSMATVYMPLVTKAWYLTFYFGSLWLIVTVSLMTSVAAVIVDSVITRGGQDRELQMLSMRKKLKALTPCINSIFTQLDVSGDGFLQWNEVQAGLENLDGFAQLPGDLQEILMSDRLVDFYDFLDADGSGEVDREEFFAGVCHLALEAVPIETTQTLHLLRAQSRALELIKCVTCVRGKHAKLAGDHPSGADCLSVTVSPQFQIKQPGGDAEKTIGKPNVFSVPLDTPLTKPCPLNSRISADWTR
jgi:hypothetical protein